MEETLKEQLRMIYKIVGSLDFADSVATMYWNLFTKFKEKGFTTDQAMQILSHFNMGGSK